MFHPEGKKNNLDKYEIWDTQKKPKLPINWMDTNGGFSDNL